jgi:stage II sporulation protein D
MSVPNADKPLPNPPDPGIEDKGQKAEETPAGASPRQEVPCEDARLVPPAPLGVLPARSALRRPLPILIGTAAAFLCVVGVIVLLRGCEHRQIIRPTPQMGIESRFWIRVRLLNNVTECAFEVPSAFRIGSIDPGPEPPAGAPALEPLHKPARIALAGGQLMIGETPLTGKEVVFSPEKPYVFGLNGHKYRGRLKLIVDRGGRSFDAINLVPLEPYVAGVIGEEMPYYWEAEALRAQAIVARTYCLFIKNRFGTNRSYDVSRTQSSQVYGGIGAESSPIWDAEQHLRPSPQAPELMAEKKDCGFCIADCGRKSPIRSSRCSRRITAPPAAHTSSSQEVFGDSFGPLRAFHVHTARMWQTALFYWPMATFDRETITKHLLQRYPKLNARADLEITATAENSMGRFRLTRIGSRHHRQTDTLRAEDLRLAVDPSGLKIGRICRSSPGATAGLVSGRGWGHGVGMCQHGAEGMARLGSEVEAILQYYYPGAEIVNVY